MTGCVPEPCTCKVQSNGTGSTNYPIGFVTGSKGSVDVKPLQSDTMYSFTLQCDGVTNPETRFIRTDYGRPPPPSDIAANLNGKNVRISWSSPLTPAGPIDTYRLQIGTQQPIDNLPNDKFFYDTTEEYIDGETKVFFVSACRRNLQKESVCSNANEGQVTFFLPATTTARPTPPSSNAPNILSHSFLVLSCLLAMSVKHFH